MGKLLVLKNKGLFRKTCLRTESSHPNTVISACMVAGPGFQCYYPVATISG